MPDLSSANYNRTCSVTLAVWALHGRTAAPCLRMQHSSQQPKHKHQGIPPCPSVQGLPQQHMEALLSSPAPRSTVLQLNPLQLSPRGSMVLLHFMQLLACCCQLLLGSIPFSCLALQVTACCC